MYAFASIMQQRYGVCYKLPNFWQLFFVIFLSKSGGHYGEFDFNKIIPIRPPLGYDNMLDAWGCHSNATSTRIEYYGGDLMVCFITYGGYPINVINKVPECAL